MSIEDTLARMADAQERTATALEAILALLSTTSLTPAAVADKPASTGSARQRKNVEREDKPPVEEKPADPAPEAPEAPAEPDPVEDDLGLDDPEPEPAEEQFDVEDVRKALKNYRDINGADAVTKVLKDHGASGMGSLKPEQYASVMKAVR